MNILCITAFAALAAAPQDALQNTLQDTIQGAPAEKLPLKVVYAGNADTPYSKAWTEFLAAHTADARFVAAKALTRADLEGRDVLLIDGEVELTMSGDHPHLNIETLQLSLDDVQGVPVVLMGGQGGGFADAMKLKTSWRHG
jgi:hypothetical protein